MLNQFLFYDANLHLHTQISIIVQVTCKLYRTVSTNLTLKNKTKLLLTLEAELGLTVNFSSSVPSITIS